MAPWLLLIHHLPPKPDYLRVKVRRRLQRVGALALKNSVYVLPRRDDALEDLEWVLTEIRDEGGEGAIVDAEFLHGPTDAELEARFRSERDADYAALGKELRSLARGGIQDVELGRIKRRFAEIASRDFFGAAKRVDVEREIARLEREAMRHPGDDEPREEPSPAVTRPRPRGAVWVTRSGVFVDRIASAWLITRHIDPGATFRFVTDVRHRPAPNEIRFDMVGAEYGHEGDSCTFEVLLSRFGLDEPALWAIARIVHDIDLKDEKFGSPEAPGVTAVLSGIARAHPSDEDRLSVGFPLFDALYARLADA